MSTNALTDMLRQRTIKVQINCGRVPVMKEKFYICRHCGNLIGMINDSGVPVICCGLKMDALVPNTVEASGEKHLPVVTVEDGAVHVNVGSVDHPMIPEHYIE